MSERVKAIYKTAKNYADIMKTYPKYRIELRKTIRTLWDSNICTYTEYQYILGYSYKAIDYIESNAYKPRGTRRIYKEVN